MKSLLIAALLIGAANTFALNVDVQVVDGNGNAIANAMVVLERDDGRHDDKGTTNQQGWVIGQFSGSLGLTARGTGTYRVAVLCPCGQVVYSYSFAMPTGNPVRVKCPCGKGGAQGKFSFNSPSLGNVAITLADGNVTVTATGNTTSGISGTGKALGATGIYRGLQSSDNHPNGVYGALVQVAGNPMVHLMLVEIDICDGNTMWGTSSLFAATDNPLGAFRATRDNLGK